MTNQLAPVEALKGIQRRINQSDTSLDSATQKLIAQALHDAGASEFRYFDVRLPKYDLQGELTGEYSSIQTAAPDIAFVRNACPAGCEVEEVSQGLQPSDVRFILPNDKAALHTEAQRIIDWSAPRHPIAQSLEALLARLDTVLTLAGPQLPDAVRADSGQIVAEARQALSEHLRQASRPWRRPRYQDEVVTELTQALRAEFADDLSGMNKAFKAVAPLLMETARRAARGDALESLQGLLSSFDVQVVKAEQDGEEVRLSRAYDPGQGQAAAESINRLLDDAQAAAPRPLLHYGHVIGNG